ncbi:hemerythrin domain-containing protein [Dactylosporangium sp. NPDC005555]|uniref:hemerythrin domain-containing protein n=1 Tax=Dactylosporangium sp. NPDC005555 TaxID=3154889 RepID=UPI0033B47204
MATQHSDRAVALSRQLAQAHQDLRRQLTTLKSDLGRRRPSDAGALTTHCIAFCAAVTAHHEGEDTGMFAELLRLRPDLEGTIAKLVEDHGMISWILSRITDLAASAAGSQGAALDAISAELDGLAAIIESHFGFEERAISAALDAGVPSAGWSAQVFGR